MANNYKVLEEKLEDRITFDEFECSFYRRDLAPVPEFMTNLLFNSKPDFIVKPESIDDLSEILKFAIQEGIPVTPRAGATSAYLNTVPIKGGIVLDLNQLRGVLDVDKENFTAEVLCATPWQEVEEYLNEEGLAICTYPSSGIGSTVGGWFSMEGYGIGSEQYGGFHNLIETAEIVLPGGKIITSSKDNSEYPLDWFTGAEGTLGVIYKVKFKIRQKPEFENNFALAFHSIENIKNAIQIICKNEPKPYNIHFSNKNFFEMQSKLGINTYDESHVLNVTYQGTKEHIKNGKEFIEKVAKVTGGIVLEDCIGDEEWNERFYSMKIKRGGPTLLASEVVLPVDKLDVFNNKVCKKLGQKVAVYGNLMGSCKANILVLYYADETKTLEYLFLLAKTKLVYDIAISLGGRPYGVGLWNSLYNKRTFSKEKIEKMHSIKNFIDPSNILNPGKLYKPPKLLNPVIFNTATKSANIISSLFRIGRGR